MLPIFSDCLRPPASSIEGPLLARGPSQSHCSELFMVSSGTRSRLSGDIFIYHVRRLSSSPFSSSPVHLWKMLSALGGPLLPALLLAPVEPLPRWRQAPPPLQRWMDRAACRIHSKTAQPGTARTSFLGIEIGIEAWRDSEGAPGRGLSISTVVLFSPQGWTGECAHGVAGVCVCVCLPVWITMMQSAAVLPTESPVKSLPEILGVPLQRKTFCSLLNFWRLSVWSPSACVLQGFPVGKGDLGTVRRRMEDWGEEVEPLRLRLSRTGQWCVITF